MAFRGPYHQRRRQARLRRNLTTAQQKLLEAMSASSPMMCITGAYTVNPDGTDPFALAVQPAYPVVTITDLASITQSIDAFRESRNKKKKKTLTAARLKRIPKKAWQEMYKKLNGKV